MDGLGGNGVNRGGRDFTRKGVHTGENGHEDGKEIDGVETDLQDGTENLIAQDWRHSGEVGISYLVVHSGCEEREKSSGCEERGPQNFSAGGFEKRYSSDDPESH